MNFLLVCVCLLMNNWFLHISMYSEGNLSKLTWLVRKIWETWSWYPGIQCKVAGWVWGMEFGPLMKFVGQGGQGIWMWLILCWSKILGDFAKKLWQCGHVRVGVDWCPKELPKAHVYNTVEWSPHNFTCSAWGVHRPRVWTRLSRQSGFNHVCFCKIFGSLSTRRYLQR